MHLKSMGTLSFFYHFFLWSFDLSECNRVFEMSVTQVAFLNPIAFRTVKTLWSFDLSECSRVLKCQSQKLPSLTLLHSEHMEY